MLVAFKRYSFNSLPALSSNFEHDKKKSLTLGRGASADKVLAVKIPYIPAPAGAATSQKKRIINKRELRS